MWYKSSYSNGADNCLQALWTKSTRSGVETCVQARQTADAVLVRDSKDPDGPHLRFTIPEWDAFTAGVKDGEFDSSERIASADVGTEGNVPEPASA